MRVVNTGATYTVQVTDVNGCTDTEMATVTENPSPMAVPGNVSLCLGQSVTMNGNPSGGTLPYNSHAWVVINGGSTGLGTGDLTNNNDGTVLIDGAGATGAGNAIIRYTVTDANGCTAQVTGTATVNANPSCSIASGPTSVCPNSTGHMYTATGGGTYQWSITGNGTIVPPDNTSSVTVDAGATGTYTVTVEVTDNGCTSTCSQTVTVEDNDAPVFNDISEITLYDQDFESPNVTPVKDHCFLDLSAFQGVNTLYGPGWQQKFTVETILINGAGNVYTDPGGPGGNYSIGMLTSVENDLLAYTFDVQNKDFLNVSFDLSAIDLIGCASFGVAVPIMRLRLYDSPGGAFNINAPGTLLDQEDLTGIAPGPTNYTFNWKRVMAGLDASSSTDGNVTLMFDLIQSGYASFDNLLIKASDISIIGSCPDDITVNNDAGLCSAVVNYVAPVATDNCPGAVSTIQTVGLGSGAAFPVGTTTETYEATDASSNVATCNFTVTVLDVEAPSITCPANITVNTPSNSCEATGVALGSPVVSDNCNPSPAVSNDASEPYALGNTIITWTADDGTNSTTCEQTVTVEPFVAPPGEYFDLNTCQSTLCPPGTYCPGGTTAGIPCPAGTSQGLSGQTSCVACPAGSFSSAIGAVACTDCPAGTSQGLPGQTSCVDCPAGSFSSATGAVVCTDCPAGTSQGLPGQTSCVDCPPGSFSSATGAVVCTDCPAGTSQGLPGQTSCVNCPPGYFSDVVGATSCTACAAGTFSNVAGATSCTACPYGTGSMAAATSCTPLDPQEISVFGNSNQIANRAATVLVSDDTDFGNVTVGNMVSHTFTIYNITNAFPLTLSGNPSVEIADRDASDFTVTVQPSTPIASGGSTTFTVKFQPSATGLRTAIIMIASDDFSENPFVFTVQGIGQ